MSGSGTTARVACEMGRQYIGIDISHEYCEIARNRVKLIANTPTLFVVEEPKVEYAELDAAQSPTVVLHDGGCKVV
jgi:site-specific DNA-methyltransferase (adenine-specific)